MFSIYLYLKNDILLFVSLKLTSLQVSFPMTMSEHRWLPLSCFTIKVYKIAAKSIFTVAVKLLDNLTFNVKPKVHYNSSIITHTFSDIISGKLIAFDHFRHRPQYQCLAHYIKISKLNIS